LLALQAYNALNSYQSHDSDREFIASQKFIFNVHQVTTLG